jgi:hypothetical protein
VTLVHEPRDASRHPKVETDGSVGPCSARIRSGGLTLKEDRVRGPFGLAVHLFLC